MYKYDSVHTQMEKIINTHENAQHLKFRSFVLFYLFTFYFFVRR